MLQQQHNLHRHKHMETVHAVKHKTRVSTTTGARCECYIRHCRSWSCLRPFASVCEFEQHGHEPIESRRLLARSGTSERSPAREFSLRHQSSIGPELLLHVENQKLKTSSGSLLDSGAWTHRSQKRRALQEKHAGIQASAPWSPHRRHHPHLVRVKSKSER